MHIAFQFFIEIFLPDQVFEADVHAVAPIIFRVGGNVDALIMRVLATDIFAHA